MFNAPVVDNDDEEEERDVRFNFGIKKKKEIHTHSRLFEPDRMIILMITASLWGVLQNVERDS